MAKKDKATRDAEAKAAAAKVAGESYADDRQKAGLPEGPTNVELLRGERSDGTARDARYMAEEREKLQQRQAVARTAETALNVKRLRKMVRPNRTPDQATIDASKSVVAPAPSPDSGPIRGADVVNKNEDGSNYSIEVPVYLKNEERARGSNAANRITRDRVALGGKRRTTIGSRELGSKKLTTVVEATGSGQASRIGTLGSTEDKYVVPIETSEKSDIAHSRRGWRRSAPPKLVGDATAAVMKRGITEDSPQFADAYDEELEKRLKFTGGFSVEEEPDINEKGMVDGKPQPTKIIGGAWVAAGERISKIARGEAVDRSGNRIPAPTSRKLPNGATEALPDLTNTADAALQLSALTETRDASDKTVRKRMEEPFADAKVPGTVHRSYKFSDTENEQVVSDDEVNAAEITVSEQDANDPLAEKKPKTFRVNSKPDVVSEEELKAIASGKSAKQAKRDAARAQRAANLRRATLGATDDSPAVSQAARSVVARTERRARSSSVAERTMTARDKVEYDGLLPEGDVSEEQIAALYSDASKQRTSKKRAASRKPQLVDTAEVTPSGITLEGIRVDDSRGKMPKKKAAKKTASTASATKAAPTAEELKANNAKAERIKAKRLDPFGSSKSSTVDPNGDPDAAGLDSLTRVQMRGPFVNNSGVPRTGYGRLMDSGVPAMNTGQRVNAYVDMSRGVPRGSAQRSVDEAKSRMARRTRKEVLSPKVPKMPLYRGGVFDSDSQATGYGQVALTQIRDMQTQALASRGSKSLDTNVPSTPAPAPITSTSTRPSPVSAIRPEAAERMKVSRQKTLQKPLPGMGGRAVAIESGASTPNVMSPPSGQILGRDPNQGSFFPRSVGAADVPVSVRRPREASGIKTDAERMRGVVVPSNSVVGKTPPYVMVDEAKDGVVTGRLRKENLPVKEINIRSRFSEPMAPVNRADMLLTGRESSDDPVTAARGAQAAQDATAPRNDIDGTKKTGSLARLIRANADPSAKTDDLGPVPPTGSKARKQPKAPLNRRSTPL